MCCTRFAEYTGCKNLASAHHRTTLSGYIFATKASVDNRKKHLVNSNISSTRPLTIWWTSAHSSDRLASVGHPSKFQRVSSWFRYLLHQRRSAEVNQTLHDVWRFPMLVHHVRILEALAPNGILPGAKLTLRPSLYWQRYCTTFEQWASAELCGVGQGNSAGWLSCGIIVSADDRKSLVKFS